MLCLLYLYMKNKYIDVPTTNLKKCSSCQFSIVKNNPNIISLTPFIQNGNYKKQIAWQCCAQLNFSIDLCNNKTVWLLLKSSCDRKSVRQAPCMICIKLSSKYLKFVLIYVKIKNSMTINYIII